MKIHEIPAIPSRTFITYSSRHLSHCETVASRSALLANPQINSAPLTNHFSRSNPFLIKP